MSVTCAPSHPKTACLRIPDSTVAWNTASSETVDDFLRELLVRDDGHCFGIEFSNKSESKSNHVGFAMRASIIDHSPRRDTDERVHQIITKGLSNIGSGPQQPNGYLLFKDTGGTWANTTASSNEDHAAEKGNNSKDTHGRDATDPHFGRRVLDQIRSPVTSAGDNEGVPSLTRFRDGRETVPFEERRVGNAGVGSRNRGYVVKVQTDGMAGENDRADGNLAELQPRKDNGHGEDHNEPKRC